jgi:hypothetical protein
VVLPVLHHFIKSKAGVFMSEITKDQTNSAQKAGQSPPTKVFVLTIGRTRFYNISVEAESAEQAEQAWKAEGGGEDDKAEFPFEYGARRRPNYEWGNEELVLVDDADSPVEDAEVTYDEVREALGLKSLEEEE